MLNENEIHSVQEAQRNRSRRIGNKRLTERLQALLQIKKMLTENEDHWLSALKQDLGKHEVESYTSEIAVLLNELDHTSKNLKKWMKSETNRRMLLSGNEKTETTSYPYGSMLVLVPWNYPLQLALMPVIGAIGAGNGVVLKPSEFAPATSKLLAELVPLYLKQDILFVVEGDHEVAEDLTQLEWDYIFFTGSQQTGQKVYQAAAKNLTPVLLELGGKNPCILDGTNITTETIQQIVWGKFLNAGQSCIAPDTVYVPQKHYKEFLKRLEIQIENMYGADAFTSSSYGRMIHQKQLEKMLAYLEDGIIHYGGTYSKEALYLSPTILVDVKPNSNIQREEIFGPILPVIPYTSIDEVIQEMNRLPVPLATYVFSNHSETIQKLERHLESGTLSVNQVILHAVSPNVPFGGGGKSGLGRYHGYASFQAFTYQRTKYSKKSLLNLNHQYPPYDSNVLTILRKLRRKLF